MARFDYFVVFAEMRTGSNFLEANLNAFDGISCLGEAFNPAFVGYPDKNEVLGIDQTARDNDPFAVIEAVKAADDMSGFRFFNDHDGRVLDAMLTDHRCAKIILTRNPIDSFISWKIARETGQWKLTNPTHAKSTQVTFDRAEFEAHMAALQTFQVRLLNTLQKTGQTAFYVDYEDLQDVDVMNGIAQFLGVDSRIGNLNRKLKKQNPSAMDSKVENYAEMETALARMDRFNLTRTPNFEPRRGPAVPHYVAAAKAPLLFLPLKSGPTEAVATWLAGLDGVSADALLQDFTQRSLRDWLNANPGHRRFAVLRHPVAWAHHAFCTYILPNGPGTFPEIRANLIKVHKVPLPDDPDSAGYDDKAHRAAFIGFLKFLRGNLASQTAIRVDAAWASQLALLQGVTEFGPPDLLLREADLRRDLALLANQIGRSKMPDISAPTDPLAARLSRIYDPIIERGARAAYARDYEAFGFADYAA